MSLNLHISLTKFTHESRVLKQTNSLLKNNVFNKIQIIALHEDFLAKEEMLGKNLKLNRIILIYNRIPIPGISRILAYFEFYYKILKILKSNPDKISVVNVHTLLLLPIGYWIKKKYNAKLVYDAHELETEVVNNKLFKIIFKRVEKKYIKHVDLSVFVSESIQEWYLNEYGSLNSIVILNCPLAQENSERLDNFRKIYSIPKEHSILLYQGGLSKNRGVKLLLDSFEELKLSGYSLVFMGYGDLEDYILNKINTCSDVYLHPAVPPNELFKYTKSADIGIHWIDDSCINHEYCMPNKLFEYINADLPVLVSNLKEMKKVVDNFQIGVVIKDWNAISLKMAIESLEKKDKEVLSSGLKRAKSIYNWQNQEILYCVNMKKIIENIR